MLRDGFAGDVLADGDGGYEDARAIFNSMIEKRPAAIAQCEGADDIAAALAFARASGLEVAVRGGGHSVAGASAHRGRPDDRPAPDERGHGRPGRPHGHGAGRGSLG